MKMKSFKKSTGTFISINKKQTDKVPLLSMLVTLVVENEKLNKYLLKCRNTELLKIHS